MTTTPSRCSSASVEAGEATVGSAPSALAWLCLEQPGSWGPKAFTSSHLDPAFGRTLESAAAAAGVRTQLIRSPGRHPDAGAGPRTVLIAYTMPGSSWLLEGKIEAYERLLDLDFAAIAAGVRPAWPELLEVTTPRLLVCTHARRDACCALLGRGVATQTAADFPGQVWEASHLSGHRFAATTALLPSGHLHGRVLDGSKLLNAANEGRLLSTGWRGRSPWSGAAQAAEGAVREQADLWDLDGVTVTPAGSAWRVVAGDRSWTVTVETYTEGEAPPSCGKAPEPVQRFRTTIQ